jgi:hypothetical protein
MFIQFYRGYVTMNNNEDWFVPLDEWDGTYDKHYDEYAENEWKTKMYEREFNRTWREMLYDNAQTFQGGKVVRK